ncbi:MAG: hypothetical protein ACRD3J_01480 [Thermoanaerobaculia bacterium]
MSETTSEPVGTDRRTYQQYLDERRLLIDGERAAGEGFDKTLLTLCAGAIALSVTFVEKVGSAGTFKPLLYVSWGILVIGLLLNVRAFLLLQNSYNRLLNINRDLYNHGTTLLDNPFRKRAGNFNHYSFWCFVAGIVLLLLFAGVNYQASSKEPPQPERTIVIVEDHQGLLARIFNPHRIGAGPDIVSLPRPANHDASAQQPAKTQPAKAGDGSTAGASPKHDTQP